jgi:hypothetical protein
MIINNPIRRLLCFSLVASGMNLPAIAVETRLTFNRDIRPILSENCFACHGFDEKSRQAELRLDLPEAAYADRDGSPPISPTNLDKSSVWQRIISVDPDEQMPPPTSHLELSVAEKETIRKWIEQGAEYESHWSLIRPQRPAIPYLKAVGTPPNNHTIDAFIRDRLAKEKLAVNSKADRETLLRRVSFDLTGLPPSIEQRNAFLSNEQPGAFANLVEQLLDSPHYGERMAMEWMDAARYADTNGFSIDGGRHMWLWRDWVIQAFNDNKPYDDFLLEQIAGDLLPNRTDAQLIATGFQRNNMVTHEGGTIPEENLTNYNADRVKTLGEAVLGLTFACAQCHNHKFDPFTQQDYYQLFAYFNTLEDKGLDGNNGVNPAPYTSFKTILQTDELDSLTKEIASIENDLSNVDDSILNAWVNQQRAILQQRGTEFQLHPVKVLKISTPNRGDGFDVAGESQVKIRNAGGLGAFDVLVELPKVDRPITGVRITALPQKDLPGGGWGQGLTKPAKPAKKAKKEAEEGTPASTPEPPEEPQEKGSFRLTAVSITLDTVPSDQVNLHRLERISRVTANSWETAHPPSHILDPRNETGWSPDRETDGAVHLTATLANSTTTASNPYMTIQLNFGSGNNYIPGMVEMAVITGTDDGTDLPKDIAELMLVDSAKRTPEESKRLWDYCSEHCDTLQTKRIARDNLKDRWKHLTQSFPTMVMNTAQKPRETFILNRGDYSQPTVAVTAATPSSIGPKLEDAPTNRLGLAQWIVHRDNPLTARVAVNRLWQMFFGTGIVATSADFGSQGEWPSHPELLDWLAVELIEHDWDIQHIVRLIVSSEAYQRASTSTPEQLANDPQNRLLARGPRFRLSAEMVRDAALQSSGLLVHRIGGPSVNPYMPVDLWREVSHYGSTPATAQVFVQDHGEKLYRRSMYTYWKRTAPPPNMMAFDSPNREVCTVARAGTTTPLQSLVTLNDIQFVECARNLAQDLLEHSPNDSERIRRAFRLCLTRDPRPEEVKIVLPMIAKELERYRANPQSAALLLSNGESPRDKALGSVEHAAWTQIASMILNLSETITRN